MGIFDALFGRAAAEAGAEQAVLIRLQLSVPEYGTSRERDAIHRLTDALDAAIQGIIRESPLAAGGHAIRRYGGPGPETEAEHVDL